MKPLSRRDFIRAALMGFAGVVGASLLPKHKPPKKRKKKMPIRFDSASSSGYLTGGNAFSWSHTILVKQKQPGLVAGIFVIGSSIVCNSMTGTDTTSNEVRPFTFVRADTNGIYRSEIWNMLSAFGYEPDVFDVTIQANLSGIPTAMMGGAASFHYFGGIGTHGGSTGTGNPASNAITPNQLDSIILSNLCTQTASLVLGAASQNTKWDIPSVSGTGIAAIKGPINPIASTTLTFNGIVTGEAWAQSSVELLSYQDNPPAIMGM